jgi:hypothetical protein
MKNNQAEITVVKGPSATPVFDGAGDYEMCSKCAEVHWVGWPCYHCAQVRANVRRRGFVNPITPYPKYLAKTPARCAHCGLAIWERTRKQTFHPECKSVWDEAKHKIYLANQLIWWIRRQGYYVLDGAKHGIAGKTDDEILVAIGHGIPLEIVRKNRPEGGFSFVKVEFRGNFPWRPELKRRTMLQRIAKYEAHNTPTKPLLEKECFVRVKNAQRHRLRDQQRAKQSTAFAALSTS